MSIVVVPDALHAEIQQRITAAIAATPESHHSALEKERERWYSILLGYFDEYGTLPEFSLRRRERQTIGVDHAEASPRISSS